jgi:hypothetical protein
MTELEKLKHLLQHWLEHNEAHVKTYNEWALRLGESAKAEKTEALKMKELAEILKQIAEESKKLEVLFKKALKIIEVELQ